MERGYAPPIEVFLLALGLSGCDDRYDPNRYVHVRDAIKGRVLPGSLGSIQFGDGAGALPASAKNLWLFDGGSFSGCITYLVFDCGNREDCLRSVECLGRLRREDLKPWIPSRYAVVMGGLDFYSTRAIFWKKLLINPWDVRQIRNGLVYEHVTGIDRSMVYYAIDLDRNRVFYHYESGGFPTNVYQPEATADHERSEKKSG
jgi:hypothetical protein